MPLAASPPCLSQLTALTCHGFLDYEERNLFFKKRRKDFLMPESKPNGLTAKLGFKDHKQFTGFLSVVFAGQLIYSCFEALKGVFYVPLMHPTAHEQCAIRCHF